MYSIVGPSNMISSSIRNLPLPLYCLRIAQTTTIHHSSPHSQCLSNRLLLPTAPTCHPDCVLTVSLGYDLPLSDYIPQAPRLCPPHPPASGFQSIPLDISSGAFPANEELPSIRSALADIQRSIGIGRTCRGATYDRKPDNFSPSSCKPRTRARGHPHHPACPADEGAGYLLGCPTIGLQRARLYSQCWGL